MVNASEMTFNVALNQKIANKPNHLLKDILKMKKFSNCNLKFNQIRKVSMSSHFTPMLLIFLALMANNIVIGSQRDITHIKKGTNALQNPNLNNNAVEALLDQDDAISKKLSTGKKVSSSNMISNASILNDNDMKMDNMKTSNAATNGVVHSSEIATSVNTSSPTEGLQSKIIKNKLNVASATNISKLNRNSIEITDEGRSGPYFDKSASKNVTALLGKTAYLNCRVKNLGNKTMLLQVSWVRHRDIHLLTVGRYTYTSDQRFRAIHQPQTEDWILQIKYPQHRDSGIYECQVSTTPHMSHYIHLNVVEPSTEIVGAPDLYIESGSTINLTCIVLNSPEPPAYIFWNHNDNIINYDSPRGGVSVLTIKGETTTSFLLIKSAKPSDSGLYQCNPSNAKPKQVTVHVLNGVSHSVSRGNPSTNAARGSSASSPVPKSLPISLYVNILIYIALCQTYSPTSMNSMKWPSICKRIDSKTKSNFKFYLKRVLIVPLLILSNIQFFIATIKNFQKTTENLTTRPDNVNLSGKSSILDANINTNELPLHDVNSQTNR